MIKLKPDDKVPLIESLLLWGKYNKSYIFEPQDKVCKYCDNKRVVEVNKKVVRCICSFQHYGEYVFGNEMYDLFNTYTGSVSIEDFMDWGTLIQIDKIIAYTDFLSDYIKNLNKWLLITGPVGCGKTMSLHIIATYFDPWAVYTTSSQFEYKIKAAINNNTVENCITWLSNIPILIIDDLGAEYYKNDAWVKNQLRTIIDNRYMKWNERITVVASNLTKEMLVGSYDPRIGSRLLDNKKSFHCHLNLNDYRRHL